MWKPKSSEPLLNLAPSYTMFWSISGNPVRLISTSLVTILLRLSTADHSHKWKWCKALFDSSLQLVSHALSVSGCLSLPWSHPLSVSLIAAVSFSHLSLYSLFSSVAWFHSGKAVAVVKGLLTISNGVPQFLHSHKYRQIFWWRSGKRLEKGGGKESDWLKAHSETNMLWELHGLPGRNASRKMLFGRTTKHHGNNSLCVVWLFVIFKSSFWCFCVCSII